MSQNLNPSTCSSLVIFLYWACDKHASNETPTEKLQQHLLVFCNEPHVLHVLFVKVVPGAPPSHPGQSTTWLWYWKGRAASVQSYQLSHQATTKIPRRAYLISARSHHICGVLHAHAVRYEPLIHHKAYWEAATLCSKARFLKWLIVKETSKMQTEKT